MAIKEALDNILLMKYSYNIIVIKNQGSSTNMDISLHPDVDEHINSFTKKETEKIKRMILYIQEYGINNLMQSKHCEYLRNYGLYEIKRKLDKKEFRVFAVVKENMCYFIHSFTKKSQKIKQKEIKKALIRKSYLLN